MSPSSVILLLGAAGLLGLGHIVRAGRWGLLFPPTYLTRRFNLLLGLAIGYAVNLVIPLRIGELVRSLLVSRRDGVRFTHVAATVFIERVVDLLTVSLAVTVLLLAMGAGAGLAWIVPAIFVVLALGVLAATDQVRRWPALRRVIWQATSVFSDQVRVELVDFFWSAAEIVSGRTLLRWRFLGSSLLMWTLYIGAFALFAAAVDVPAAEVLDIMLNHPLNALLQNVPADMSDAVSLRLILFTSLPILGILAYGALRDHSRLSFAWDQVRRRGKSGAGVPAAARKRFQAETTYDYFLSSLFSGSNQLISGFGLQGVDDCRVHKFFKGGSDAVTALVEVDERLLIRKFAAGPAATKLKVQSDWLRQRSNGDLPLVKVAGESVLQRTFTYDMPLVTPSNDFYDVIHTSPAPHSRALLKRVIGAVADFHALTVETVPDGRLITEYLDVKAAKNARTVLDFARSALPGSSFILNGEQRSYAAWDRLLDPAWLASQVRDRRVAQVHGDLTIENIIIAPDEPAGFYIIDPNPENIFDSPLIDWAKLMQSLHLGYETLNQGLSCDVSDGVLRLRHVRSQAYADLHLLLEAEIRDRLGADALREVYFHEIINYLRLTTYKIRQSRMRGLGFFACTAMLLDRYAERYG